MSIPVPIGVTKFPDQRTKSHSTIIWDPTTAISAHGIIVGSSGSGKTYRLRHIIQSMVSQTRNINIHILDVHGDIARNAANRVEFSEITDDGLNPLEVVLDPEFGGVRRRINSFIAMINRTTSKLGTRQEAVLRNLLNDLYVANGYDARDPRTWNPRTNKAARGYSRSTGLHPGISELRAMCYWRLNQLITGAGSEAFRSIHELNKVYKKLSNQSKKIDADDAKVESLKLQCKSQFGEFIDKIETGTEIDEYINYDNVDTLISVHERLKSIEASGVFKDSPPTFRQDDPFRVYDIKALTEDEQSMFAEILLERLFTEAKARGPRDTPDTFIVIDEAHKFMSDDRDHILNRMAREIRKFGVGLLLLSQTFDHFPNDLIENSAMTMVLGLHDNSHAKTATRLGLKRERLKFIRPKQSALVQVRSSDNNSLTNTFHDVILPK